MRSLGERVGEKVGVWWIRRLDAIFLSMVQQSFKHANMVKACFKYDSGRLQVWFVLSQFRLFNIDKSQLGFRV